MLYSRESPPTPSPKDLLALDCWLTFADHASRSTASSYPDNGSTTSSSNFIPIPELYTDDADLHIIFLQGNGVYFNENTTDPWYRGTRPGPRKLMSGFRNSTPNVYQPEEAASPMACLEKFQFCNANKDCGPLSGTYPAFTEAAPLFNITAFQVENGPVPSDPVGSRFYWYYLALFSVAPDVDLLLRNLGPKALQSQESLLGGFLGPLPDNQWQLDVKYWWATRLAGIQAAFVNTASNTGNAALDEFRVRPYNSYMQDMCDNQVILPTFSNARDGTSRCSAHTKANYKIICRKSKALTSHRSASLDYTSPT